jgi:hypothetical protein
LLTARKKARYPRRSPPQHPAEHQRPSLNSAMQLSANPMDGRDHLILAAWELLVGSQRG